MSFYLERSIAERAAWQWDLVRPWATDPEPHCARILPFEFTSVIRAIGRPYWISLNRVRCNRGINGLCGTRPLCPRSDNDDRLIVITLISSDTHHNPRKSVLLGTTCPLAHATAYSAMYKSSLSVPELIDCRCDWYFHYEKVFYPIR